MREKQQKLEVVNRAGGAEEREGDEQRTSRRKKSGVIFGLRVIVMDTFHSSLTLN